MDGRRELKRDLLNRSAALRVRRLLGWFGAASATDKLQYLGNDWPPHENRRPRSLLPPPYLYKLARPRFAFAFVYEHLPALLPEQPSSSLRFDFLDC